MSCGFSFRGSQRAGGFGNAADAVEAEGEKAHQEEDPSKPLTDDQIASLLQGQGIEVTRRTVAKYREDMRIPSTHQRRVRK